MNTARERIVVIGGGMAAARFVQRLAALGSTARISVISAEPMAGYNRVLLPAYLERRCDGAALCAQDAAWYASQGIAILAGQRATRVDLAARRIHLADGSCLGYDRLVFATGSRVPLPAIPGIGLDGVDVLRALADADRLRARLAQDARVVVIGGGLLGLEAAHALAHLGAAVTVVHRNVRLMNRQLDAAAAALLRAQLEARGIAFRLGRVPAGIVGRARVAAVALDDGEHLAAGSVVFASGTVPEDALAAAAGMDCRDGIRVDAALDTARAGVHAIGECANVAGHAYALVEPVHRQADVLAARLCGEGARFAPPVVATRLKVDGIELFALGDIPPQPAGQDLVIHDAAHGVYRRLVFSDGRFCGAVLLGDTSGSVMLQQALGAEFTVAERERMAFALEPRPADTAGAVALAA